MSSSNPRTDLVQQFCSTSTTHGVLHLRPYGSTILRRCIWALLLTGAIIGCTVQTVNLLTRYNLQPTNTEVITAGREVFVFPDITLCPSAPFIDYKWNTMLQRLTDIEKQWKILLNSSTENEALVSIGYSNDTQSFLKQPVDHVISCRFNNLDCSFLNFTILRHPTFLLCITFTVQQYSERLLRRPGLESGLELILNVGGSRYYPTSYNQLYFTQGYTLAVHAVGTRPDFTAQDIMAQTGHVTDIRLRGYSMQRESRIESPCVNNPPLFQYTTKLNEKRRFNYSKSDCRLSAYQNYALTHCGCYDDTKDLASNLITTFGSMPPGCIQLGSACNVNDAVELSRRREQKNCVVSMTNLSLNLQGSETCLNDCFTYRYQVAINIFKWPTKNIYAVSYLTSRLSKAKDTAIANNVSSVLLFNVSTKEDDIPPNIVIVRVFAEAIEAINFNEENAYPLDRFFSDFGGTLGLWIGVSVISMAEILEFLIRYLWLIDFKKIFCDWDS